MISYAIFAVFILTTKEYNFSANSYLFVVFIIFLNVKITKLTGQ